MPTKKAEAAALQRLYSFCLNDDGTEVIKPSSEVHMRRNSKSELDDTLHFFAAGS